MPFRKPPVDGKIVCISCNELKSLDAFPVNRKLSLGVSGRCRACFTARAKLKYHTDPVRRAQKIASSIKWNTANRDRMAASQARYHQRKSGKA